jgi:hypothetical protein
VFVEAEHRLIGEDVPQAVRDFFQPDVFVVESLAQRVLTRMKAEGAGTS